MRTAGTRLSAIALVLLLVTSCTGRVLPGGGIEEVVSKYTTLPPAVASPPPLDVYQLIATNIAERITSPVYRWLGYTDTSTQAAPKKQRLELAEELASSEDAEDNAVEGGGAGGRDVEPLSDEAQKRLDKVGDNKPEKVTLHLSYLPPGGGSNASVSNDTALAADDDFDLDDFADPEPTDKQTFSGGWVFVLEAIGSFFTLLFGAIAAYFKPSS